MYLLFLPQCVAFVFVATVQTHSRKEESGWGGNFYSYLIGQSWVTEPPPSCKGVWRDCLSGHIIAPGEIGILVVRKRGD